jgi:hypothetical protein
MQGENGKSGEQRLHEAIRRFNQSRRREVTIDERPGCVFGLLTRDRIEDAGQSLDEVRQELVALKKLLSGIFVALTLTFLGVLVDLAIRAAGLP